MAEYTAHKGRELNLEILRQVFENDIFKVLRVCREYGGITVTFSEKTAERAMIAEFIRLGWSNKRIQAAMDDGEGFDIERIKRIRRKIDGRTD